MIETQCNYNYKHANNINNCNYKEREKESQDPRDKSDAQYNCSSSTE